jgi:hypothetical protein
VISVPLDPRRATGGTPVAAFLLCDPSDPCVENLRARRLLRVIDNP